MSAQKLLAIICLVGMGSDAMADQYKVHYSIRGLGKDIIVNAESSSDARHTVQDMFPEAMVTGVSKRDNR
jgi:cellobiose-specific phosphotransferase system component IIB